MRLLSSKPRLPPISKSTLVSYKKWPTPFISSFWIIGHPVSSSSDARAFRKPFLNPCPTSNSFITSRAQGMCLPITFTIQLSDVHLFILSPICSHLLSCWLGTWALVAVIRNWARERKIQKDRMTQKKKIGNFQLGVGLPCILLIWRDVCVSLSHLKSFPVLGTGGLNYLDLTLPINPRVLSPCPIPYLHLPQGFGTGGGRGRLPAGGSQKDMLLLPVLVTGEKLLLLSMEQPHHVTLKDDPQRRWGKHIWRERWRRARCRPGSHEPNSPPSICHLCCHSISWKGLSSSLYCSWRNWPKKKIRVIFSHIPQQLHLPAPKGLISVQETRLSFSPPSLKTGIIKTIELAHSIDLLEVSGNKWIISTNHYVYSSCG